MQWTIVSVLIWRNQPDGTYKPSFYPYLVETDGAETFCAEQTSYGYQIAAVERLDLHRIDQLKLLDTLMALENALCASACATLWQRIVAKMYFAGRSRSFVKYQNQDMFAFLEILEMPNLPKGTEFTEREKSIVLSTLGTTLNDEDAVENLGRHIFACARKREEERRGQCKEIRETSAEARLVLRATVERLATIRPDLQRQIDASVEHRIPRKRQCVPCHACHGGKMHYVGRKSDEGMLRMDGVYACDICGEIESAEPPEDRLGLETSVEARAALQSLFDRDPTLADVIAKTTVPIRDKKEWWRFLCPSCEEGSLHLIGRHRLPGGTGMGGFLLCDRCGYSIGHR